MSTAAADRSYVRRERLLGAVLILLIALTAAHFVHDSWLRLGGVPLRQQHAPALAALPKAAKLYAPVAYRIAIPTVVAFLMHIFPRVGVPSLFAGMDVVCLTGALWMIYLLSSARIPTSEADRASRGATVALTLMFCTAALFWLPQYQRPETTPTALFLAFSVLSVQRQHRWMLIVQLLCTALQAFLRADVPVCLGLGMLIASRMAGRPSGAGMRTRLALQGLAVVLIGGGIQLYLQLVRFPHLTYDPQTPLFVFRYNLYVHMWGDGALALAPVWLAVIYGLRRVPQLVCTPEDAVALAAGALYLPLWMCVGLLSEVRIYLPFLLVLSPLAALAVGRSLGWTSPRVGLAGTQTAATCAFE